MSDISNTNNPQTKTKKSTMSLTNLEERKRKLQADLKETQNIINQKQAAIKAHDTAQAKKDRTRFLIIMSLFLISSFQKKEEDEYKEQEKFNFFQGLFREMIYNYEVLIENTRNTPQPQKKTIEEHQKFIKRKISTLTNEKKLIERYSEQVIAGTFK